MPELISHQISGAIPPVLLNRSNGDGRHVVIVDWGAIARRHTPAGAKNVQLQFFLEELQCDYWLPSRIQIPGSAFPIYSELRDDNLTQEIKIVEWQRRFSPASGHAIQFLLWESWEDGSWGGDGQLHFGRDYLYNLGQEGHIDMIKPYLHLKGGIAFGDKDLKLAMSIAPQPLEGSDRIWVRGGYTGQLSYVYTEAPVELTESWVGVEDLTTGGRIILFPRPSRAALYLCNAGNTRIYWAFGNFFDDVELHNTPFLEPGEVLTYENGSLHWSGGGSQYLPPVPHVTLIALPLYAAAEFGTGRLTYQEFTFTP